jgi:hypothetical protein
MSTEGAVKRVTKTSFTISGADRMDRSKIGQQDDL